MEGYSISSWSGFTSGGSVGSIITAAPVYSETPPAPSGHAFQVYLNPPNASSGSVQASFANNPPSVTLSSPANGSGLAQSTPTFTFSYSDPDGDAQQAYEIQVGTNASFATGTYYDSGVVSSSVHSFSLPSQNALNPSTLYYWRVQAWDAYAASSGWTSPFSFTNTSAPQFNLANGGTNLANESTYAFPAVNQGSTTNLSLSISNSGSYVLQVNAISSSNPQIFPVTYPTGFPVSISPGQSIPLNLAFSPTSINNYSSVLEIQDSDPKNNPFILNLTGIGYDFVFRYKAYLYEQDGAYIYGKLASITNYWTDVERAMAQTRIQTDTAIIAGSPTNLAYWGNLLDTYYDAAEAENLIGQQEYYNCLVYAMGFDPQNVGLPLIGNQINQMIAVQQQYYRSLQTYFPIFTNTMGLNTQTVDPTATNNPPFGYYIFQKAVPSRSVISPLLQTTNGTLYLASSAPTNAQAIVIANGYKDLALLMQVEREYAESSLSLARLYFAEGNSLGTNGTVELQAAESVINATLQSSYVEMGTLLSTVGLSVTNQLFTGLPSTLVDSIKGWQVAVNGLTQLESALNSNMNPLGLPNNMLVLVQSPLPGSSSTSLPSYDNLAAWLVSTAPQGPLTIALADWTAAQANYTTYRESQDTLASDLTASSAQYDLQLEQITGADPSNTNAFNNPFNNPGSELAQEELNLLAASNNWQIAEQNITNQIEQIQNAIAAAGQLDNIANAESSITLNYGSEEGTIQAYIGSIAAQQAFIQNVNQLGYAAATQLANLATLQGLANSALAQMAQAQQATIYSLQGETVDVNSAATIKGYVLQLQTLALDAINAAIQIQVEQGKIAGLEAQESELLQLYADNNASLANSYFADPSRQVQLDQALVQANFSFQTCQSWMYLTLKALEYKWSLPFTTTYNGQYYDENFLYQCSNAQQLQNYLNAMNNWDASLALGPGNGTADKFFSFRQDFLGIQGSGAAAVAAFQNYITNSALVVAANDPSNPLGVPCIRLHFSTAKETTSFFLPSRALEKITYMGIKLDGSGTTPNEPDEYYIDGYLYYGGTGYLRNLIPGTVDPNHPDQLDNDVSAYPVRWWYQDPTTGIWDSASQYYTYAPLQVANNPNVSTDSLEITAFQGLSVAASDWTLYIALEDYNGNPVSNFSNLTDIEVHFSFNWYNRLP